MLSSEMRTFFKVQILVWAALIIFTRLSWFDPETVPSWTSLILYSTFGFICSSGLAVFFTRLFDRPAATQIALSLIATIGAALLWRGSFNALSYHVLMFADNHYEFWGYFHYGRQSTFQLLCWSGLFWAVHYYRQYYAQLKAPPSAKPKIPVTESTNGNNRVALKDGNTTRLIDINTIESIVSGKDYLCITVGEDVLVHRATMKGFIENLPSNFMRCHRSHTVNIDFVVGIANDHDQTSILMHNGDKHSVSRRYKGSIKSRLSGI
ncbi:LytR/AlgR family response regulator transcription factor [Kordiimonas aquimaris]|uniref:LytR/AlgR family response regulator transcription factor n=1 Tax=Kordiimonas aquimaris TaxID=707591 RepID=UPI0021D1B490|nr:LytTR family DNA-binding domain-containing protein [Kordiimonas aquimaris]